MGVDRLIDLGFIGWYRVLRILGHVILFIPRIQQDGVDISVKLASNITFVFRKLCRNNLRLPREEAVSTDIARNCENNRSIYRLCKCKEPGWLSLINNISTFTGSGYPEKVIVKQSPRDVSVNYVADEFHINSPEHYAQVTNIV